jgi:filamentous hemagglutinin family protein
MKTLSELHGCWKLSVVSSLVVGRAITLRGCLAISFAGALWAIASSGDYALAQQIVGDNTLGAESSKVTSPISGDFRIDGGATRGTNLFHSFSEFSVPSNGIAFFNNALNIENIISRVTGGSISNIDGLIRTRGAANLFLLNPNGIIFGPNAHLDIGGSLLASTASSLNLSDGNQFSATATQTTSPLTVSVPLGLQYGRNVGNILVQGSRLAVQPGKTLALVGGNVTLVGGELAVSEGTNLAAPGGRIELGSVAANSLVNLTATNPGWALGYNDVQNFQDIQLSQGAAVDASGEGGGNIQVQGRSITLTDESGISADTLGSENGGGIFLRASQLSVRDGAGISASTYGAGRGGNVIVTASESVELSGDIYSNTFGAGAGGNLTITTGRLTIRDGAVVSSGTFETGSGGTLSVTASDFVELVGISADGLFPSSLSTSTHNAGQAGDLKVDTKRLIARDGGRVSASTFGTGRGGTLTVTASEAVELIGVGGVFFSGLFTRTIMGDGAAGDLRIATGQLIVQNGGLVDAGTFGNGKGGTLSVNASESVEVIGTSPDGRFASALSARVNPGAKGDAGNLTIQTRRLIVRDGAQVSAGTSGAGQGGTLTVSASDFVELIGTSANGFPSRLTTQTFNVGTAGDLRITTGRLIVRDQAQVAVNSRGTGNAGNLEVTASSILLDKQGKLTAETASGQGGNISLQVQDLLLMRDRSSISTSAGTAQAGGDGGNITINAKDGFIVAVTSENSDIRANAFTGKGGNVQITAQDIFGTQFRPQDTLLSDITASSTFGVQGTVQINTPDVDPSRGLAELPGEPVNVEVAQGCQTGGKQASIEFFNTGKGGLAPNPYEPLSSSDIWEDVPRSVQRTENLASDARAIASPAPPPDKLVEAQGWLISEKGEVVLVAEMPATHTQGRCRLR